MKNNIADKKNFTLASVVFIIILGMIVYSNSFSNKFVYDDENLIKKNIYIKNWSHIPKIFTQDMGQGAGAKYNYYRPLHLFTYLVDYSFWGFHSAAIGWRNCPDKSKCADGIGVLHHT